MKTIIFILTCQIFVFCQVEAQTLVKFVFGDNLKLYISTNNHIKKYPYKCGNDISFEDCMSYRENIVQILDECLQKSLSKNNYDCLIGKSLFFDFDHSGDGRLNNVHLLLRADFNTNISLAEFQQLEQFIREEYLYTFQKPYSDEIHLYTTIRVQCGYANEKILPITELPFLSCTFGLPKQTFAFGNSGYSLRNYTSLGGETTNLTNDIKVVRRFPNVGKYRVFGVCVGNSNARTEYLLTLDRQLNVVDRLMVARTFACSNGTMSTAQYEMSDDGTITRYLRELDGEPSIETLKSVKGYRCITIHTIDASTGKFNHLSRTKSNKLTYSKNNLLNVDISADNVDSEAAEDPLLHVLE